MLIRGGAWATRGTLCSQARCVFPPVTRRSPRPRKNTREDPPPLGRMRKRRRFLIRPRGGGSSRVFFLGRGDLLVTGGKTQRAWEHSVPRVAHAPARISIAFRHGMDSRAYGR